MKIISYWYEEFVAFLRDIAVFIDGNVYWDFENDDESGYVEFIDGEVIINTGQMNWQQSKPDDVRDGLKVQDEKIKAVKMLLRKV